jgi:hypothetical protein
MQRHHYDRKFKEKERKDKGKGRANEDWEGVESRYKDAVEEKKGNSLARSKWHVVKPLFHSSRISDYDPTLAPYTSDF